MGKLGMDDADVVAGYASQIDTDAQQLQTIISAVDGVTKKLHQIWHGPNSDQFRAEWTNSHRPALNQTFDSLTGLSKIVRNNLVAQIRTSDTLDGTTVVPGAIPVPTFTGGGADGTGAGTDGADSDGGDSEPPNIDKVSENLTDGIHDALNGKTEDDKGVPVDVSMQQTLLSAQKGVDASAHTNIGGMDASADANAALAANVTSSEHVKLGADGLEATAGLAAFAGGTAGVSAGLHNQYSSLAGNASVTAGAQGEAEAKVGLTTEGLEAEASAGGFVGAQAQAQASGDVGGIGGAVAVHAYAGAGMHLGADADFNEHEVKLGVHVGAALGVGVGIDPTITVHPDEVISTAKDVAESAFGWL